MTEEQLALPKSAEDSDDETQAKPKLVMQSFAQVDVAPKPITLHFKENGNDGVKYYAISKKGKSYLYKRKKIDLQACTAMCGNQDPFQITTTNLSRYINEAKLAGQNEIHHQLMCILRARVDHRCKLQPLTEEEQGMIFEKKAQGLKPSDIAKVTGIDLIRIKIFLWHTRYYVPGFKYN